MPVPPVYKYRYAQTKVLRDRRSGFYSNYFQTCEIFRFVYQDDDGINTASLQPSKQHLHLKEPDVYWVAAFTLHDGKVMQSAVDIKDFIPMPYGIYDHNGVTRREISDEKVCDVRNAPKWYRKLSAKFTEINGRDIRRAMLRFEQFTPDSSILFLIYDRDEINFIHAPGRLINLFFHGKEFESFATKKKGFYANALVDPDLNKFKLKDDWNSNQEREAFWQYVALCDFWRVACKRKCWSYSTDGYDWWQDLLQGATYFEKCIKKITPHVKTELAAMGQIADPDFANSVKQYTRASGSVNRIMRGQSFDSAKAEDSLWDPDEAWDKSRFPDIFDFFLSVINSLRDAIKDQPGLEEPLELYRYTDIDSSQLNLDSVLVDGFQSWSTNRTVSEEFNTSRGNCCMLRAVAMEGVKLLPLINIFYGEEYEMLLDGVSKYRDSKGADPLHRETPYRYEITHSVNRVNRHVNIWPSAPAQERPNTELTLVTFNCDTKERAVRDLLYEIGKDFDIIMLQEAPEMDSIAKHYPEDQGFTVIESRSSRRYETVACIVNTGRGWRCAATEVFEFTFEEDCKENSQGTPKLTTRYAMTVLLDCIVAGRRKQIRVGNCHLPGGKFDEEKIMGMDTANVRRAKLRMLTLLNGVECDIICGDFNSDINTWGQSPSQSQLRYWETLKPQGSEKIFGLLDKHISLESWNDFPYNYLRDQGKFHAQTTGFTSKFGNTPDAVWYGPGKDPNEMHRLTAKIIGSFDDWASDHLPIVATRELGKVIRVRYDDSATFASLGVRKSTEKRVALNPKVEGMTFQEFKDKVFPDQPSSDQFYVIKPPRTYESVSMESFVKTANLRADTVVHLTSPKTQFFRANYHWGRIYYRTTNGVEKNVLISLYNFEGGRQYLNAVGIDYKSVTRVTIPAKHLRIDKGEFQGYESLETITDRKGQTSLSVVKHVTQIEDAAFEGCRSLREFDAPNLISLGERSFAGASLQKINIPKITEIPEECFESCNFVELRLPDVTEMGENAFANNQNLRYLLVSDKLISDYEETHTLIKNDSHELFAKFIGVDVDVLASPSDGIIVTYDVSPITLKLPSFPAQQNVESLLDKFSITNIFNVRFPEFHTTIFASCFQFKNVARVQFQKTLKRIHSSAFEETMLNSGSVQPLESQTKSELILDVDFIGRSAFSDTQIESATLSAKTISMAAFSFCNHLQSVKLLRCSILKKEAFVQCKKLRNFYMPTTMQRLYTEIFKWSGIKFLSFAKTISVIELKDCEELPTFDPVDATKFPSVAEPLARFLGVKVQSLHLKGYGEIINADNNEIFPLPSSALKSRDTFYDYRDDIEDKLDFKILSTLDIRLPEVTNLPDYCLVAVFRNVTFPSTLKKIGQGVFENMEGETVDLPDGLQEIGALSFHGSQIKDLKIPDSVSKLGRNCFADCDQLTSVVLGANVTIIPKDCFADCRNLMHVIGPNVIEIQESAFFGCRKLKEARFSSLEYIGKDAFEGVLDLNTTFSGLKKLNGSDRTEEIAESEFYGITERIKYFSEGGKDLPFVPAGPPFHNNVFVSPPIDHDKDDFSRIALYVYVLTPSEDGEYVDFPKELTTQEIIKQEEFWKNEIGSSYVPNSVPKYSIDNLETLLQKHKGVPFLVLFCGTICEEFDTFFKFREYTLGLPYAPKIDSVFIAY